MASTSEPISRAFVSSSKVAVVTFSSATSANTQTFTSDHLQLLEERDELLGAGPVVFELLAGLTRGRLLDVRDLLARAGPADLRRVETEVGGRHLVDRLVLRR